MTINSNRKFRSNTKQDYLVQDMYKGDRKGKEKYNLFRIEPDGRCKLCYDLFLDPLKFKTIREAQMFVMLNEDMIEIWDM